MLIVALPGASASAPGNPEQGLPMDFVRDECALASDACEICRPHAPRHLRYALQGCAGLSGAHCRNW